jgi:hypothetical protein
VDDGPTIGDVLFVLMAGVLGLAVGWLILGICRMLAG